MEKFWTVRVGSLVIKPTIQRPQRLVNDCCFVIYILVFMVVDYCVSVTDGIVPYNFYSHCVLKVRSAATIV